MKIVSKKCFFSILCIQRSECSEHWKEWRIPFCSHKLFTFHSLSLISHSLEQQEEPQKVGKLCDREWFGSKPLLTVLQEKLEATKRRREWKLRPRKRRKNWFLDFFLHFRFRWLNQQKTSSNIYISRGWESRNRYIHSRIGIIIISVSLSITLMDIRSSLEQLQQQSRLRPFTCSKCYLFLPLHTFGYKNRRSLFHVLSHLISMMDTEIGCNSLPFVPFNEMFLHHVFQVQQLQEMSFLHLHFLILRREWLSFFDRHSHQTLRIQKKWEEEEVLHWSTYHRQCLWHTHSMTWVKLRKRKENEGSFRLAPAFNMNILLQKQESHLKWFRLKCEWKRRLLKHFFFFILRGINECWKEWSSLSKNGYQMNEWMKNEEVAITIFILFILFLISYITEYISGRV